MKFLSLLQGVAVVAAVAAGPARAQLTVGALAPAIDAPASVAGQATRFSLADALRRGPVVVYFYPSAYTGGCNLEAHTFALQQAGFLQARATVVGVSLDDLGRLNAFSADPDYCGGKVAVVSDADGRITQAYGVPVRAAVPGRLDTRGQAIEHGFAERLTYVVRPDGRVSAVFRNQAPADHVALALKEVQRLAVGAQ